MQKVKDFFGQAARIIVLSALAAATFTTVFAWVGPSTNPPGSNASAPINISATSQTKTGTITASDFLIGGTSLVSGNIGHKFGGTYTLYAGVCTASDDNDLVSPPGCSCPPAYAPNPKLLDIIEDYHANNNAMYVCEGNF